MVSKTFGDKSGTLSTGDLDTNFDEAEATRIAGDDALAAQITGVNAAIQDLANTRLTREQVIQLIADSVGGDIKVDTPPTISVQGGGVAHAGSILEHTTVVYSATPQSTDKLWSASNGSLGGTTNGDTYTVQSGEEGRIISYRETATKNTTTVVAQSANTITVVTPATPVNTVAPAYTAGVSGSGASVALSFGSGNTERYYSYTMPAVTDNTFTFACWVRMDYDPTGGYECFFSLGNPDSTNGFGLYLADWGWQVCRPTVYGKLSGGSDTYYLAAPDPMDFSNISGKDYLLAYVADGTNHRLYLVEKNTSAVAVATQTIAGSGGGTGFSSATMNLGREGWAPDWYARRPAGEFMYWDTNLSDANLTTLATGVDPSTVVNPVIRHSFITGANAPEANTGTGGTLNATQNGSGWSTTTGFTPGSGGYTTTPSTAVTVNSGTWTLSGGAFSGTYLYQWFLNGNPIADATSTTYNVPAGAITNDIYKARVTAHTDAGTEAIAYAPDITLTSGSSGGSSTLVPVSDSRTILVLDGDLAYNAHGTGIVGLQLHDGSTAAPGNSGSKPQFLENLAGGVYYHADGTTKWIGRETRNDGKNAWTMRMKYGQPMFTSGGDSLRAEVYGDYGSTRPTGTMWEDSSKGTNEFWGAIDLMYDADGLSITSDQGSAHCVNWYSTSDPLYSDGYGHGYARWVSDLAYFIIAGPGNGPTPEYDVRTTPLSTTIVAYANSGGQWGTGKRWRIWTPVANVSFQLIWHVKLDDTLAGNPFTHVWRRVGSGIWEKIIEDYSPNTNTNGGRYWKAGGYNLGASMTAGQVVTTRYRSMLVMRALSGTPTLNETELKAWLAR